MPGVNCMAMLLAGGEGRRLGVLTEHQAKPSLPFGNNSRIIDFTLNNCANSGITTIGVLTQYKPQSLHRYLESGRADGPLRKAVAGLHILDSERSRPYTGTANAVYQNLDFMERQGAEYVLVLAGDHIYSMDYAPLLQAHIRNKADATVATIRVPWEEASSFGIVKTERCGRMTDFAEKPAVPPGNEASMGIYVFTKKVLKDVLRQDEDDSSSSNDFGQNIIPSMLREGSRLYVHRYEGYWRDVGTIDSLWKANMDLLKMRQKVSTRQSDRIRSSLIGEGCRLHGTVTSSVIGTGVIAGPDSVIEHSVVMPNAVIGRGARIYRAIIGEGAVVEEDARIGSLDFPNVTCTRGSTSRMKGSGSE